jgi:Ala-tRNA(Pro) deacylase
MTVAKTIENFLEQHRVGYRVSDHSRAMSSKQTAAAAHVPPADVAKAVVLGDANGYVMAVVPADRYVELHRLTDKLGRQLEVVNETRLAPVFKDCEIGAIPPLGPAYHMETIVDESLVGRKKVWFAAGDHDHLICVDGEDFVRLLGQARFARLSH